MAFENFGILWKSDFFLSFYSLPFQFQKDFLKWKKCIFSSLYLERHIFGREKNIHHLKDFGAAEAVWIASSGSCNVHLNPTRGCNSLFIVMTSTYLSNTRHVASNVVTAVCEILMI